MIERIDAEKGAPPVGPYSPAVRANGLLFLSGQIPMDPETGEIVRDSIEGQVRQTLENLKELLEAAGSSLDRVLKCGVYLSDLKHFETMNAIYTTYFTSATPPARSTVQVAALPKGVDVEIDVIALE